MSELLIFRMKCKVWCWVQCSAIYHMLLAHIKVRMFVISDYESPWMTFHKIHSKKSNFRKVNIDTFFNK